MVINVIGKTMLEHKDKHKQVQALLNANNAKYAEPQVRKKPFCDL